MPPEGKNVLACAVYTRKSSEEGLQQEFNSLHAQREACEAFILSQRHEGWHLIETKYDDGGFSGGNMDRPALAALMTDVRDRKVDVIVVYKVDRLTRSLADFAKIVEILDSQGVSFVSVTQQFNTTTSMGRLTLNVLLSFAQFEREVTGERIRDKIAASKKKGMFMGGGFPLGYDLVDHKLVVNDQDAGTVRAIFTLYCKLKSVRRLQSELARSGILTKVRTSEAGRKRGGESFSRGHLYYMLRNRTYLGEIPHKGQIHAGQHTAIIDRALWNKVQGILSGNARARANGDHAIEPSPLAGLIFDDRGNRMTPSHTSRGKVRYRYYICHALLQNQPDKAGPLKRVPADEIETIVLTQLRDLLGRPIQFLKQLGAPDLTSDFGQQLLTAAAATVKELHRGGDKAALAFARGVIQRVVLSPEQVTITINAHAIIHELGIDLPVRPEDCAAHFALTTPVRLTRSGRKKSMIVVDADGTQTLVNDGMVLAIARALKWDQDIRAGDTLDTIAKREGVSPGYVTRVMPLAFLAPDIVEAIYEGRQPAGLQVKALSAQLPLDWDEQKRALGFTAH